MSRTLEAMLEANQAAERFGIDTSGVSGQDALGSLCTLAYALPDCVSPTVLDQTPQRPPGEVV